MILVDQLSEFVSKLRAVLSISQIKLPVASSSGDSEEFGKRDVFQRLPKLKFISATEQ